MKKQKIREWTKEELDNVTQFFSLLLKIDKRNNPHLYKENKTNTQGNSKNTN